MAPQDRLIGRTLGRYTIESMVGKGGLAAVYRANDLLWDVPVAVKVLPEFFATDEEHRQRFQREASTMAVLVHPNIMPVRDYGQAEGVTYFVMDYAEGGTLEDKMGRPLSVEEASHLLQPIISAVEYAHHQGVVHRDLKPSNVLFDSEERSLVADFGIAKLMAESGLTRTRESLGTPEYMAPEQAREAALVGAPADVYALGVILFQLVAGQTPYQGNTAIDIIEKHKYAPIPSVRLINPQLPASLEDLLRRALAKEPSNRIQSAGEFGNLLRLVLAGSPLPPDQRAPVSAPTPPGSTFVTPPGQASPLTPHPTPAPATYYPPAPQHRSSFPVIPVLLGVVAIAAVAAILYFVLGQPQPDSPYQAGLACFQREDWGCCVENFQKTLALDPGYRDAASRMAQCQDRQITDAQGQELKDAWSEIARCKSSEDWDCVRENALAIATKLDRKDDGARKEFAEASLTMAQGIMDVDPEIAIGFLRDVQDLEVEPLPANFQSTLDLLTAYQAGATAYAGGNWQTAIDELSAAGNFRDSQEIIADSHVRLCRSALAQGDLKTADQEVSNAKQVDPQNSDADTCADAITDAHYEATMTEANALLESGMWEDAIAVCRDASSLDSAAQEPKECMARANEELYRASLARGQDLLARCHLNEAIAAFNEAQTFKPNDSAAQSGITEAQTLQKPVTTRLADSYDDWSSNQGTNGWYYLAHPGGQTQEIPWGGDAYWLNRGEGSRIQRDGQHPGRSADVTRRWRSNINGSITVNIQHRLENPRGNTQILLRQNGRILFNETVSTTSFRQAPPISLTVSSGDNIDLVVGSNGNQTNDMTLVRMTIEQMVPQCTPQ